ncbi:MAG: peptidylprolyl isomerase [Pseudomonadota bacterium]
MSNPTLTLTLKDGDVVIEMLQDVAPKHVEQITKIVQDGSYDGIAWHRVIDGFMAQTGDVEHGKVGDDGSASNRAGTGGSKYGNIDAEFSKLPFDRGVCGMARSQMPNSANSQFFIMFEESPHLNGQYTVWGRVTSGMEHVDAIKMGGGGNGSVSQPDVIIKAAIS